MFVLWSLEVGHAWFGCVDVDCVVCFFSIETDFKVEIVAGESGYFGTIEGQDMVYDRFDRFLSEISVVDS